MIRQPQHQLLLAALLSMYGAVSLAEPAAIDLRDGDRVVFVGGTFIERMQQYGYLETVLTVAHADKNITFRNLGWSGDTVRGESRALFGSQADGFARLVKDIKNAKPTLLIICYGANEAHAGKAGLPQFIEGLNHLLDELAATKARVVLLSPYAYQAGPPGSPSPATYNTSLRLYCDAIQQTASKRNAQYISLYNLLDTLEQQAADTPLTENGLHLTKVGYRRAAFEIVRRMGVDLPKIDLAANGARLGKLRATIRLKNELYFHRYRPQNETYLFLFRKHEQGNNAVEIPQFDPLVEEQETRIAKLKMVAQPS